MNLLTTIILMALGSCIAAVLLDDHKNSNDDEKSI